MRLLWLAAFLPARGDAFRPPALTPLAPPRPSTAAASVARSTRRAFELQSAKENEVDVEEFRRDLIKQMKGPEKAETFDGYAMYDVIVEKWSVPYFIEIKKSVFAGKPMLSFNVMWKHLGQASFPLSEQEYLEHLEALAQLLVQWDRVAHFKRVVSESKKRPQAYFGYAVPLALDLPPDTLAEFFNNYY